MLSNENRGIKKIKNYRLIKEIGSGAVGIVYEAIDDLQQKRYAIKSMSIEKIRKNPTKEKEFMSSMKQELKILKDLNQNNIIKIFGVEKTLNNIYLVLEHANGGNLYEFLSFYKKTHKQPLPERSVQFIIRQITKGLEYLHSKGIAHRDIKLENILLNFPQEMSASVDLSKVSIEESIVKIADLGYAKELSNNLGSTICGTPLNMAPDMIFNFGQYKTGIKKTYNTSVDLWSLGTITYELLCGDPPFYARSQEDLFELIMQGKYNIPKNEKLSIEVITFLNGLLQFYPEKRFSWTEINQHPFIKNKVKDFHFVNVEQINPSKNMSNFQLDSKDANNFLWVLLKPKDDVKLDRIDNNIFRDPNALVEYKPDPTNQDIDSYEEPEPNPSQDNVQVFVDVKGYGLPTTGSKIENSNQTNLQKTNIKDDFDLIDDYNSFPEKKDDSFAFLEEFENVGSQSFIILDEDDKELVIGKIENYDIVTGFYK